MRCNAPSHIIVLPLAITALLLSSTAFGQTGGLAVFVVDGENNPIPGATVVLAHPRFRVLDTSVYTGEKGRVVFPVLRRGSGYAIEVVVPGCQDVRQTDLRIDAYKYSTVEVVLRDELCPEGILRDQLPDVPPDRGELIVFIGRLREIEEIVRPEGSFNHEYEAVYEVEEVMVGSLDVPEVSFVAYDHYGFPEFAKFDTVMLYLSRFGDRLVHEKYLFNDVYRTVDNRWAGCGDPYRHEPEVHRGDVQAMSLDFAPIDVSRLPEDTLAARYPKQLFEYGSDFVKCTSGVFAEQLLEIKLDGVLRARYPFDELR